MGLHYTRFGRRRRSQAQKEAVSRNIQAAQAARGSNKENIPTYRDSRHRSHAKAQVLCQVTEVEILREKLRSTQRQLHNERRQHRRAKAMIASLKAEKAALKAEKAALKTENRKLSRNVSKTSPSNDAAESVSAWKELISTLRKQKDALRKQIERKRASHAREMEKVLAKAQLTTAKVFYIKHKGQITGETRRMIRGLIERGVPFRNVLSVVQFLLGSVGITVEGSFGPRTVRRAVIEGKVYATLQIADEIARAESMTISGDGTTLKNVHLESAFVTYKVDGTEAPQLRALPVIIAPNHTSQEQLNGWKTRFEDIIECWNNSPFGPERPLSLAELLSKSKGMLSDHANDQKNLARLFEKWKEDVDREARGQEALMSMSATEFTAFGVAAMEQCLADLGGYEAWDALPDSEKLEKGKHAHAQAVRNLGQEQFEKLPEDEQRWASLFLWAGCGMHKEMNSVKWGAQYMEKFWSSAEAGELGAVPPLKLFNKDNAAIMQDEGASSSRARAEQVTARGGVKTTSIAGAIFRNKYEKKGQQDNYRWYFATILGFIVRFPDTSNTRFGSHCEAASELLVHLVIYIQFLELVRNAKDKIGLNHMEQNLWNALHDGPTLTELAVLSLYSQTISHPYMREIRGSTTLNGMELGPFHQRVIAHCAKFAADPMLLLAIDADSYKETTLDGGMWERPEAVYAIQHLYQEGKLPFLPQVLAAFFRGAIFGWERFSSEYEEGGRIDQATHRERDAAFVRASNCHNESRLGRRLTAHRHAPAMSHDVWNARTMHKSNNTEAWVAANTTPALDKYVARIAREQDRAGTLAKARRKHVDEQQQKATTNREKQAKRAAHAEKVEAIVPHLDPEHWTSRPLHEIKAPEIQAMLTWLRAPSRKRIVQVPTGLGKPGVGKEGRFNALVTLLQSLTADQLAELQATQLCSGQEQGLEAVTNDISFERGEPLESDEDL